MTRAAVLSRPASAAGVAALCALVGAGVALSPWVTSGVLLGAAVLALCLFQPLLVVGAMLFFGLVDLSLLTGGWKSLFVEAGGLDMNGIRLMGATLGFGAVVLAHAGARDVFWSRLGRTYALFLAFAAATLVLSSSAVEGARLWFKLAYPFLVFVLVLRLPTRREQLERLMDLALAGAAFVAVILNPLLVLFGAYTVDLDGQIRLTELSAHQTVAAPYFVIMILIALTRYATRRQVRYLALAAACAPWVVIALARMAFLEAMAGLLILGLTGALAARNYRLAVGTMLSAAAIALLLIPAVLRRSLGYVPGMEELWQLLRDPAWLAQHVNTEGRALMWPLALQAFLQHPLVGLGLGSTRTILMAAVQGGENDVHNEYLRIGATTGLVGAGLLASAVGGWLVRVVRLVRSDDALVREFAFPAIAGVAVLALDCFASNTFDYYTQIVQYVFFLLAGAMAAASLAEGEGAHSPGEAERQR